ncbi:DUF5063 domain-containing protein [Thiocapsa marina]|uniref:DUF5063 domain-containing protein n=1 Tax=Thiocapsa marina 5811 TaxID=768671 RepID=F9U6K3_9GAMM|nr:DUF5063 domain-containing protein [Thiocapsa marina]EGV19879.1 hypothetical protein ThimaDRAFT_0554 [Thiocapsa marina 5811]
MYREFEDPARPSSGSAAASERLQRLGRSRAQPIFSSTLLGMDAIAAQQLSGLEGLEVAGLARRYCDLIEGSAEEGRRRWLGDVASLLPRLQAAISSVSTPVSEVVPMSALDLDARFELFWQLRRLLADRDGYWLEFDRASEGVEGMTGSLADDLTDIYCELKSGLGLYARQPECALRGWAYGFDRHWGRHLVDAERHLVFLAAQGRLEL